jgi:hypothetical protein
MVSVSRKTVIEMPAISRDVMNVPQYALSTDIPNASVEQNKNKNKKNNIQKKNNNKTHTHTHTHTYTHTHTHKQEIINKNRTMFHHQPVFYIHLSYPTTNSKYKQSLTQIFNGLVRHQIELQERGTSQVVHHQRHLIT